MNGPHGASGPTKEPTKKPSLGSRTFRCSACRHTFHERTATPFNVLEYPTDVVLLVVLWRLGYTLSLRDLAELFLERRWGSRMRRFGSGKHGLLHFLRSHCERNGHTNLTSGEDFS